MSVVFALEICLSRIRVRHRRNKFIYVHFENMIREKRKERKIKTIVVEQINHLNKMQILHRLEDLNEHK